jgi:hypothetical protein
MAANERLMRQSIQAGFNGGWLAACMAVAEIADRDGANDFATAMREMAQNPQPVEIVEVQPDWHCDECGHEHATNMGGICVGCPCPRTEPIHAAAAVTICQQCVVGAHDKCLTHPEEGMELALIQVTTL